MLAPLLAAFCLTQLAQPAVANADDRVPLLVLDLSVEGGVDPSLGRTATALVSSELAGYRSLNVISNADVRAMMELEGSKQQAGCGDTSCLAELAGALGARLVVFGSMGMLGQKTTLNLNLFDSKTGQSVGRQFVEVTDLGELSTVLPVRIRALIEPFALDNGMALPPAPAPPPAVTSTTPPAPAPPPPDKGPLPLALTVGGAGGVVVGAVGMVVGILPLVTYQARLADFEAAKGAGDVVAGRTARDEVGAAAFDWNTWGIPVVVAGAAVATAGLVAGVVGAVSMVSE